jgi:hypothetical protein
MNSYFLSKGKRVIHKISTVGGKISFLDKKDPRFLVAGPDFLVRVLVAESAAVRASVRHWRRIEVPAIGTAQLAPPRQREGLPEFGEIDRGLLLCGKGLARLFGVPVPDHDAAGPAQDNAHGLVFAYCPDGPADLCIGAVNLPPCPARISEIPSFGQDQPAFSSTGADLASNHSSSSLK